jgi:hypothetical protein
MLRRVFNFGLIGLLVIGSAVLGASPASAEDTWTVTPGGSIAINGGPLTIYSPTGEVLFRCSSWGTDGQLSAGTGLSGANIGSIMRSTLHTINCSGQFSIVVEPNWPVSLTRYRSDWNWTYGDITAGIAPANPFFCAGGIVTASFIYYNSTGELWSSVVWPTSGIAGNQCIVALGRSVINPLQTMTSP